MSCFVLDHFKHAPELARMGATPSLVAHQLAFFGVGLLESVIARPAVLKVLIARKLLPSGCLAPALDDVLVALVERVLQVQQRHHQMGEQTRPNGIEDAAIGLSTDRAKQIQAIDLLSRFDSPRPALGHGSLYLLPGHAVAIIASGWRKSIIWSRRLPKKSLVMALISKTPKKQLPLNMSLGVLIIGIHPIWPAFMRGSGVLQNRLRSLSIPGADQKRECRHYLEKLTRRLEGNSQSRTCKKPFLKRPRS